jgi:LacI family transcriptional regulator
VSQTTVSLVMNDVASAAITAETRARVHEAIAALDYHPHVGARNLSRQATHTLGVAIPDAGNPHYLEITEAIEAYAAARGYSIVLIVTNYDLQRERTCLRWLKEQRMDALIVCTSTGEQIEQDIRHARAQGYQVTTFLENLLPAGIGERALLDHLVALGHRRIGHVHGVADQQHFGDRLQSLLARQQSLGVPVEERWIARCGPRMEDGYQATTSLLDRCPASERPTVLIAVNDVLAMGVLAALHTGGIAVPAEISVASFDNTRLARFAVPPLTSVDPQAQLIGDHVARLAFDRLTSPGRPATYGETTAQLVVRASTGPAPQP